MTTGDGLKKDIAARVNSQNRVNDLQEGADFVVNIPQDVEQSRKAVCAWDGDNYSGDFFCFGPGEAAVTQDPMAVAGKPGPLWNPSSLQFHGGANVELDFGGGKTNLTVGDNTPNLGGPGGQVISNFRVF